MKKARFTESQIIKILSQQESGRTVTEICREYGIHQGTFYNWKSKYGGMNASQLGKQMILSTDFMQTRSTNFLVQYG